MDLPSNISDRSFDELTALILSKSRAKAKIVKAFVFDKMSVNGIPVKTDCSYCIYIREETDPENVHCGRQKVHYPQVLYYEDEDIKIDNRTVIHEIPYGVPYQGNKSRIAVGLRVTTPMIATAHSATTRTCAVATKERRMTMKELDISGTRSWKVKGLIFTTAPQPKTRMMPKKFVVRYTSDSKGKSLSIADEVSGVMFQIPFEEILNDIKEE